MGAPFILQLCFCWIFARWLRSRNLASFAESIEPALRDPTRGRKAGGFRDSRRSTAAMSISLSEISFKIVSPDPVDAVPQAAASFRAADLRSERASLS
jgi:hypothetical protein